MKKLRINNTGSFTIEAVYVILILVGIIFSMLYILFYSFDQVNIECKARQDIEKGKKTGTYIGQLGQGTLKMSNLNILESVYEVEYRIPMKFPLTKQYVENRFTKFHVVIPISEGEAADFVRKYDAVRSEVGETSDE